ncbi:CheF family chemotaxis protein [Haloarculaceae archaeon H-GB2-1]|nr:CheF family chemotaxis protein [Haloarculaceae archaeon H-GB1-1]MEA5385816.1 CheF family chemotaxis protein [Haloarculaceae archaeon H-GB11]MEA5407316.1 CheF family chemotaxis protein [Haloarculaceae archaeon H-GB2-1]
MSEGEQKLSDTTGKFAQVVKDGRKVPDLEWIAGRILLSNKRLILASNEGKKTLPLSKVRTVKGSQNNQALAQVSGYLSVQVGNDVMLVSPKDSDTFEETLYSALLDQKVVLVKHPAVKGGVVKDSPWQKSRLKLDDDAINLATADGTFIEIELADVGGVERDEKAVLDSQRKVLEVEHSIDGTSVETHFSGPTQRIGILAGLLQQAGGADVDVELSKTEQEVLMALYSGVSPFQISEFVGMDVDDVEQTFDQLVEKGVLEAIRTRRNVSLKARGRHIASDVIAEQ